MRAHKPKRLKRAHHDIPVDARKCVYTGRYVSPHKENLQGKRRVITGLHKILTGS